MGSIPATTAAKAVIGSPNVLVWEGQCGEGDFASMLGLNESRSFTLEINPFTWTLGVLFLGRKKTKEKKKKNVFLSDASVLTSES